MTENWEEIDQYIMDALSVDARDKFDQRLAAEPALRAELQLRQDMLQGAEAYGRKALKQKLQGIHQAMLHDQKPSIQTRPLWPYLTAAASVLLLIAAVFWFNGTGGSANSSALYVEYFSPYEMSNAQRSANEEQVLRMEQFYRTGNYEHALAELDQLLSGANPQSSDWLLAAGVCQLELNKPAAALIRFAQITSNQDFNFRDEVSWYSALAHLKNNDRAAARAALQALISDPNADHHTEAQELLRKMNL